MGNRFSCIHNSLNLWWSFNFINFFAADLSLLKNVFNPFVRILKQILIYHNKIYFSRIIFLFFLKMIDVCNRNIILEKYMFLWWRAADGSIQLTLWGTWQHSHAVDGINTSDIIGHQTIFPGSWRINTADIIGHQTTFPGSWRDQYGWHYRAPDNIPRQLTGSIRLTLWGTRQHSHAAGGINTADIMVHQTTFPGSWRDQYSWHYGAPENIPRQLTGSIQLT